MVSCCKKIAAYESEIRFDPSSPDLGDLAIPHAIVSFLSFFILFIFIYFVVYQSQNKILLMNLSLQQYNILNKIQTIALSTLKFW
jgi:hypothetical protein